MSKIEFKPLRCSSCQQSFTGKDIRGYATARFPYVLECKHSVCAACLKSAQNTQQFSCPKCDLKITMPKNGSNLDDFFLPDIYALGLYAFLSKPHASINDIKPKIIPAGCSSASYYDNKVNSSSYISHTKAINNPILICDTCCDSAIYYCEECKTTNCSNCFQENHSFSKKLNKHKPKPIKLHEYRSMLQKSCKKHIRMPIEFICDEDQELLCCSCVQSSEHKQHKTVPIIEKNKMCFQDLKESLTEAKSTLKRLRKSEKFLEDSLQITHSTDTSGFEMEIRDHFHLLHSVICRRENELIRDLRKAGNQSQNQMDFLRVEIKNKLLKLQFLLNDADQLLKNHYSSINGVLLIKELKSAAAETNTIVYQEVENDEIRVSLAPSSVIDTLAEIGNIQCFIDRKFKLCKGEDELDISDKELETEQTVESHFNQNKDLLLQNTFEPWINYSHKVLEADKVQVTSITSPGLFYVQRMKEIYTFNSLSDSIQKWCRKNKKTNYANLTLGELYLALYEGDKQWYRARVEEIFYTETKRLVGANCDKEVNNENLATSEKLFSVSQIIDSETQVKVKYIDFGNVSIIKTSEIREMKKSFLVHPPFAIKCCLWQIEPHNCVPENEWSKEAIQCFYNFVNAKQLTMRVMSKVGELLEVDLIHPISMVIESDNPVSVREALVFMEYAAFPNSEPIPNLMALYRPRATMHKPELLPSKTTLGVVVKAVENPSKFFIQVCTSSRYVENLQQEMEAYYSSSSEDDDFTVYVPKIDQPYVAILGKDEVSYHRVVVQELPGYAQVKVFDVDTGSTYQIPYLKLRKIGDKFLELPMQATVCCLADVQPIGEKWSPEAIDYFIKTVNSAPLEMTIHKSVANTGYIVSLYSVKDDCLLCINSLLVKEEFAACALTGSVELMVLKNSEKLNFVRPDLSTEPKSKKLKKKAGSKKKFNVKRKDVPKPIEYIEVLVSNCENPGYFYIQYNTDQESLKKLINEMNEHYEDSAKFLDDEIKVDGKYAVFDKESSNWYRATVTGFSDEDCFLVLDDIGIIQKHKKGVLCSLLPKFSSQERFATLCSLGGLKPAGDATKWSNVACEEFIKKVVDQVVYLGKSLSENGVLLVHLFNKVLIPGGALEADRTEYRSINDFLRLELGVALPDRNVFNEYRDSQSSTEETKAFSFPIPQLIDDFPKVNLRKPSPSQHWLDNELPKWNHCVAIPTHIGYDGSIFLQTKDDMVNTCKEMCKGFEKGFAAKPILLPDVLKEGQICCTRFHLDNKWYRATIVKVYPENVLIRFVDYGNEERVSWNDIRTEVSYLEIPLQRIQCDLHNVRPISDNGQWTIDALNYINITIVDKLCVVQLQEEPIAKQNLQVSLILTGGISLVDLLVKRHYARKILSDDEFIPLSKYSFKVPFPDLALPDEDVRFPVVVPIILECTETVCYICLQRIEIVNPETEYEISSNKEYEKFLEMGLALDEAANNSPTITNPRKGEMCCAQYSLDNDWYRAVIVEICENKVVVMYTDYGNSEEISLPSDRIKVLPEKFYEYPSQGIICKLYGIAAAQPHWCEEIKTQLKHLLDSSNYYAEVKVKTAPYEVNLFSTEDDVVLAYQSLIDNELLVKL